MLKIPAGYDRDTTSAKFKDISCKLPASLLHAGMMMMIVVIIIIIIWLYSPNRALTSPLGFRNNNLFTGLDC
jgi:hypothetical protein